MSFKFVLHGLILFQRPSVWNCTKPVTLLLRTLANIKKKMVTKWAVKGSSPARVAPTQHCRNHPVLQTGILNWVFPLQVPYHVLGIHALSGHATEDTSSLLLLGSEEGDYKAVIFPTPRNTLPDWSKVKLSHAFTAEQRAACSHFFHWSFSVNFSLSRDTRNPTFKLWTSIKWKIFFRSTEKSHLTKMIHLHKEKYFS